MPYTLLDPAGRPAHRTTAEGDRASPATATGLPSSTTRRIAPALNSSVCCRLFVCLLCLRSIESL